MLRHAATALICALFSIVTGFSLPGSKPSGSGEQNTSLTRSFVRANDRTERSSPSGIVKPVMRFLGRLKVVPASISRDPSAAEPPQEFDIGAARDAAIDPEPDQTEQARRPLSRAEICQVLKEAAAENELPVPLFTRLIWQESRFRSEVVSHAGARGIAQFMPETAAERGLEDPFDPIQALPASADFLRELMGRFGNFGLAAAAYNSGPRRVSDWLAGKGGLPKETRDYVVLITGLRAEDWAEATIYGEAHPEAFKVQGCNVRPMRAALALIKRTPPVKKTVAEKQSWGAQLAGDWSEKKALATYARLSKKYPQILGKRSPKVVAVKSGGKSAAKQTLVRVAADTRSE
ncbi:MAG: lytic transglycosylase domain-containing protein, partial [Xanthobacteraceae bacterium]